MARIRSVKPGFFVSEDVSDLPLRARLTWIGLWTHCDDHGRTKDNLKLIKAAVWALDDVSLRDVEDDLNTLADSRRIVRYEVGGQRLLAITNWHHHQSPNRPTKSRFPPPPVPVGVPSPDESGHCEACWAAEKITESSLSSTVDTRTTHVGLTEDSRQEGRGEERKGKEGTRAPRASSYRSTTDDRVAGTQAWKTRLAAASAAPQLEGGST